MPKRIPGFAPEKMEHLPPQWREIETPTRPATQRWYRNAISGLRVIVGIEIHQNDQGKEEHWLHVSFSHVKHLPGWLDIRHVRDVFVAKDLKAIMVFPKQEEYVNFHEYALHFYANLDRDPLPDFRQDSLGDIPLV